MNIIEFCEIYLTASDEKRAFIETYLTNHQKEGDPRETDFHIDYKTRQLLLNMMDRVRPDHSFCQIDSR